MYYTMMMGENYATGMAEATCMYSLVPRPSPSSARTLHIQLNAGEEKRRGLDKFHTRSVPRLRHVGYAIHNLTIHNLYVHINMCIAYLT